MLRWLLGIIGIQLAPDCLWALHRKHTPFDTHPCLPTDVLFSASLSQNPAGVPPSGNGKMYFHYICAMSPDWEKMPVTLWYNGGPGAPSTFGLFQEFGPFLL